MCMDETPRQLIPHTPGSLYEAFTPEEAKALWNRSEFIYTPREGLNNSAPGVLSARDCSNETTGFQSRLFGAVF